MVHWVEPIQVELEKDGIHSIGTVRMKRLKGCTLISDQDLKKRGRGHYEEKSTIIDDVELTAIKWYDNRAVTLLTSYSSAEPFGVVKRFDRKTNATVDIACPHVQCRNGRSGLCGLIHCLVQNKTQKQKMVFETSFSHV